MRIVFCGNDTGMVGDDPIPGGQTHRYLQPVWDALQELGVEFSIRRNPEAGALNVYTNNRETYPSQSQLRDGFSVHVSHGLASKGYRDHSKTRTYRHMFVPGDLQFREVVASGRPARKLEVAGYPKLDPLFPRRELEYSRDPSRVRVLYAPTHGGGGEKYVEGDRNAPGARATSYWRKDEVLQLLQEAGFEVTESLHPRHSPGHKATFDEYVTADVVVADGGSTLFEAGVLGIPVVTPAWITRDRNIERGGPRRRTLESVYYVEEIGYHASSADELCDKVLQALQEGQDDKTVEFMEGIVPSSLRGVSGVRWAERLVELSTDCDKL